MGSIDIDSFSVNNCFSTFRIICKTESIAVVDSDHLPVRTNHEILAQPYQSNKIHDFRFYIIDMKQNLRVGQLIAQSDLF
jgi:hypothetical protein